MSINTLVSTTKGTLNIHQNQRLVKLPNKRFKSFASLTGGAIINVCKGSILLKKSAMVCASEKYASEIEIFTFGRGFRTWISRSSAQKRRFHQSMVRQFGQTDFFNSIGRLLPATKGNTP